MHSISGSDKKALTPEQVEKMKRDAGWVLDGQCHESIDSDVACHVLALADEVERLRSQVAALRRACEAAVASEDLAVALRGGGQSAYNAEDKAVAALRSLGWPDGDELSDTFAARLRREALAMTKEGA